jgi:hypothetical protein
MRSLPGRGEGVLLATVLAAPSFPGGGVSDLFTNRVFLVGFWAWFLAQTGKVGNFNLGQSVKSPHVTHVFVCWSPDLYQEV